MDVFSCGLMIKSNPFVMGTFSYWKQVKIHMISLEFEWAGSLRNVICILTLLNRLIKIYWLHT